MIDFCKYSKIYNKYCVCYFGPSDEYLVQMNILRKFIERKFPGVSFCLGCKSDKKHLIDDLDPLNLDEIKVKRADYAYVREIKFDGIDHPVEEFLNESGIDEILVDDKEGEIATNRFVIIDKGSYPTKNLNQSQIDHLAKISKEMAMDLEFNGSYKNAGIVAGVESATLFQAAAAGIKTILIPNGIGTRLYKRMWPNRLVMDI